MRRERRVNKTIARKLLAMVLVSAVTATATASAAFLITSLQSYAEGRRASAHATARAFAVAATPAILTDNKESAESVLRSVAASALVDHARIERADGTVLAAIGSGDDGRDHALSVLTKQSIRVAAPIRWDGATRGKLVIVARTPGARAEAISIVQGALLACFAAAAMALLVASRLRKGIVDPIAELAEAVQRIRASQSYDDPVPTKGDDEIGVLVDGFNAMIAEIRARDLRIEAQVRNLERQVEKRTEDLRLAKNAAEDANRTKSRFLATVSHEIRTPMHGVLVMAELLAAQPLPQRQKRYAEVIVRSGKALLSLINDLLDLSKIEAGKLHLEKGEVDLCVLVDQSVALFGARARVLGLDIATLVDPSTPKLVAGDALRIGQILANLIGNALKFTDHGYVLVTVRPDPASTDRILISVRDTGIGIPADKIDTVFGAFAQGEHDTGRVDESRGGTGLGLAICRKLARAMSGDVRVSSVVGKGSVFVAALGLKTIESAAAWPRLSSSRGVLIDTQRPATRRALEQYFREAGFELLPRDADLAHAAAVVADEELLAEGRYDGAQCIALRAAGETADVAERWAVLDLPLLRSDVERVLAQLASGAPFVETLAVNPELDGPVNFDGAVALVADDNEVNREVAREALALVGVEAVMASDGAEAVKLAASRRFDIVLMDGGMPHVDGFEATRRIRAWESQSGAPRVPIVGLTANVLGLSPSVWRDSGADEVLYKPFAMADFAAMLERRLPAALRSVGAPISAAPALAPVAQADPVAHVVTLGGPEFVQRIVQIYLNHVPARMQALVAAADAGDWDETAKLAHAVKSMSLSLRLDGVARAAAEVERKVRVEGLPPPPSDIAYLEAVLADHIDRLSKRFSERPTSGEDSLAAALASAIARDALDLAYQPIVDRGGGRVVGFEALLRWPRSDAEPTIAAPAIVACAEANGLAPRLGEWTLRRASRDAARWANAYVAVNVSPSELRDHGFAPRALAILSENGLPPSRLALDVTEQSTLSGEQRVIEMVLALKAHGVQIALDDFGTGYSSLTHLTRFPIDAVKIDRGFIADLHANVEAGAIIHSIAAIGRTLRLAVVAKGVESPEQAQFLRAAGVTGMQGYFFGRPMSADEATAFVAKGGELGLRAAG